MKVQGWGNGRAGPGDEEQLGAVGWEVGAGGKQRCLLPALHWGTGPIPCLPKIHHLLSPPSPSGVYSTSHHGGSSWKTGWNSKVLTELYGFWHFAFFEAWIFFITDLYYLLVSSSSVSNEERLNTRDKCACPVHGISPLNTTPASFPSPDYWE